MNDSMNRDPFECDPENCPALNPHSKSWYNEVLKPFAFFVISALLAAKILWICDPAMSVSHLCDKYSASNSFRVIKVDLGNMKAHLNTLSMEIKNVMDTRDDLRSKLREVSIVIPKMTEAVMKLRNEVSEEIGLHTKTLLKAVSLDSVRDMIQKELETYDADKTGRTDYALENSGGTILSTRNTEPYSAGDPVLTIFGIPLCQQQNTPRAIIQTGTLPGECWAFKGSKGAVVIQLLGPVYITGISLEHISASISPTGETSTAPKDFSIWGLNRLDDKNGFFFGDFTYAANSSVVQYFDVKEKSGKAYEIVELKIQSNHGNKEYTCVYRIRIHGTLHQ